MLRVSYGFRLDRYLPFGHNDRGRESIVGSIVVIDRGSVIEGNLKRNASVMLLCIEEMGMQMITRPRPSTKSLGAMAPINTYHVGCTLSLNAHLACGRGYRQYASGRRMVIICSKDKGDKA